ncbi:MAG: hypothetical protein DI632_06640 [Sphingomonas hengshuiensis]|uniref:Uncharacterized protein n=1 Tax=Sphingomonas hengshuiensis TaxID=1609977 RepID=A0A2W4ZEC0_9SPHN|nr:MAG: hypothetical protein DI632_06640 [Sphingomonas hengshuiensis]
MLRALARAARRWRPRGPLSLRQSEGALRRRRHGGTRRDPGHARRHRAPRRARGAAGHRSQNCVLGCTKLAWQRRGLDP